MRAAQPIIASGGRSLSLQSLARAGATLVGRPVATDGERVAFDDSVMANVAAGDAFAARARGMIDELIARRGLDAPPYQPDDTEGPVDLDPPRELDLRDQDIAGVVWCTGFVGDFSFLDQGLVGADGQPRHQDAAAAAPGVWYVGLKWLVRRNSGILHGFPRDAAEVAAAVRAHLDN
jgi:putative flavoprotein involved in K+ transport